MKTTAQVIAAFLDHQSASNGRISTDGTNLYSYSTLIAYHKGTSVYVTQEKYSITTTGHVDALYRALGSGWSREHGTTERRKVSISVDKTGGWQYSRGSRPGSVGNRAVDKKGDGEVATFAQVIS